MKHNGKTPKTSLYGLLARDAPIGVILRRGPAKQVLLIAWNTETDEFIAGQWFNGRIYEWGCHLSPSGDHLAYCAATHRPPWPAWTAISRPPYLTAVAQWRHEDTYAATGVFFESDSTIVLEPGLVSSLVEFTETPAGVTMKTADAHSWKNRDERLGWAPLQAGEDRCKFATARYGTPVTPLQLRSKPRGWGEQLRISPRSTISVENEWQLQRAYGRFPHKGQDVSRYFHVAKHAPSGEEIDLGLSDWADWCQRGDLLFSQGGRLFRMYPRVGATLEDAAVLADFSDLKFREIQPTDAAKTWDEPLAETAGWRPQKRLVMFPQE